MCLCCVCAFVFVEVCVCVCFMCRFVDTCVYYCMCAWLLVPFSSLRMQQYASYTTAQMRM